MGNFEILNSHPSFLLGNSTIDCVSPRNLMFSFPPAIFFEKKKRGNILFPKGFAKVIFFVFLSGLLIFIPLLPSSALLVFQGAKKPKEWEPRKWLKTPSFNQ